MYAFLFSDANWLFSIAIGFVLVLFTIEMLGVLFGLSLMGMVDDISPIELNIDADVGIDGGFTSLLSWLCLDKLPLMIWLVIFLTGFGLTGYLTNFISIHATGFPLENFIAVPIAIVLGLFICGSLGSKLAQLMPKNESSAAHDADLEGRIAEITIGKASQGSPAEAKCIDDYHQMHYVMVEPIEPEQVFNQHEKVILITKQAHSWLVMRYSSK